MTGNWLSENPIHWAAKKHVQEYRVRHSKGL